MPMYPKLSDSLNPKPWRWEQIHIYLVQNEWGNLFVCPLILGSEHDYASDYLDTRHAIDCGSALANRRLK